MYVFQCPICNNSLEADESWQGMQTRCPACGHDIVVPNIQVPRNQSNPIPVLLKADEKLCPLCGEVIKKGAVFCRFCHKSIPMADKSVTIAERICGIKAAKAGQYGIGMMFLMAGCTFILPILGLLHLIAFIILTSTNENHKYDTFMLQFGLLFVTSIMAWIFWIVIFNL